MESDTGTLEVLYVGDNVTEEYRLVPMQNTNSEGDDGPSATNRYAAGRQIAAEESEMPTNERTTARCH